MKIILILPLILMMAVSCSKGKGGSKKKGSAPTSEFAVSFDPISNNGMVPNEDLEIRGHCKGMADGATFDINVGGVIKTAVCDHEKFEVNYLASEIPAGDIIAVAEGGQSAPVHFKKLVCNSTQNAIPSGCEDQVIVSPSVSLPEAQVIGPDKFIGGNSLTVNMGGTSSARFAYIFTAHSDCQDYISNGCHIDNSAPACSSLNPDVRLVLGRTNFNYNLSSLVSGSTYDISIFYANGTETSSCFDDSLKYDSAGPQLALDLDRVTFHDPTVSPVLDLNGGLSVVDVDGAGLDRVEVAVSDTPMELPTQTFESVNIADTTYQYSFLIPLSTAVTRYFIVRSFDKLGNKSVAVSSAMNFVPCSGTQTLNSGSCQDNPVSAPELNIAGATLLAGSHYISSNSVNLSMGGTSNALRLMVFDSAINCANHISLDCSTNPLNAGCSLIPYEEKSLSGAIAHTFSGLVHSGTANLSGYYINGQEKSTCISKTVKIDTAGPIVSPTLSGTITYDPAAAPKLLLGAGVSDSGDAGVASLEVGLSSNGSSSNVIAAGAVSVASTEVTLDLGSYSLLEGVSYRFFVRATDNLGQITETFSPAFTYEACTSFQDLVAGICVDKDITGVQALITNATSITGNLFVTNADLTLSSGTTAHARKMFSFASSADCSNHLSNGCHSSAVGACELITALESTPSAAVSYSHPSMTSGSLANVSVYYWNGSKTSTCQSVPVTLDNESPTLSHSVSSALTYDPLKSPEISLSSIIDVGGSGVDTIELGISSNGTTTDFKTYTQVSTNDGDYEVDLAGLTPVIATDYRFMIRAKDKLGNERVITSAPWRYTTCTLYQTPMPDGSCDNHIANITEPVDPGLAPCDGTATRNATFACSRESDGSALLNSQCNVDPLTLVRNYSSPAGDKVSTITNGSITTTCAAGATTGTEVYNCNAGHTKVGIECVGGPRSVAMGFQSICTILQDGTTVKCSGSNGTGHLGAGNTTTLTTPATIANWSGAKSIHVMSSHQCAIFNDGKVKCAGSNGNGQLGTGNITNSTTPVEATAFLNATQIVLGTSWTCARFSDNTVKCAGSNSTGNFGNGGNAATNHPAVIAAWNGAVKLFAGASSMCAKFTDGSIKCAGHGLNGAMGTGGTANQLTPYTITAFQDAIDVQLIDHNCALFANQTVKCTGFNNRGQLGNGNTTTQLSPISIPAWNGAIKLRVLTEGTCVQFADKTVKCAGSNSSGQFGNGATTNSSTPIASGYNDAIEIYSGVGASNFCALMSDTTFKCSGYNLFSTLGTGGSANVTTPYLMNY